MTSTNAANNASHIAAAYIAVWNELNPVRRRALIAETFTAEAGYVDPMMRGAGHEALDAMIAAVQQQFAGLRFDLHGKQDGHNDVVRFSWSLAAQGAAPLAYGTDVAVIAEDGRIRSVTGFLDAMAVA
ncbi:nuclear transport factor 2 family protein [Undibacterium sp.]|jgi:hypothetical protein|uniref:nuclear transport factor 2 family protein n=1 Tax=Undibacterium sp. TaxID=1914977 RepID=UPI002C0A6BF6|nr:nuclear transport factor 2 family protein [Undibacterium sp.]HTD02604.1 nuclear transport factor 2 family protein [Undibacterium sp.]